MPGPTHTERVRSLRRRISDDELRYSFSTSSGPGGQNVNKVSTRVTLRFDLAGSAALSDPEKRRIRGRLGRRVTSDGSVRLVSSRYRTQSANRRAVTERFYELLADALTPRKVRKATRPSAGAKRRQLAEKRRQSEKKQRRASVRRRAEVE